MNTGTRFHVRDCPDHTPVAVWLNEQTGFQAIGARMRPSRRYPEIFEVTGLALDVDALARAIREVFREHGWHGWRHAGGESPAYGGFSLLHNPDRDARVNDPHADVLGTDEVELGGFLWDDRILGGKKGSYMDAYAFRARTPGSRRGALGELLDGFHRSLVRSSVRELHARYYVPELGAIGPNHPSASVAGWHRDETVFENLRINIPVTSDPIFTLDIASPDNEPELVFSGHLAPGRAYVWDTFWPHRPMANARKQVSRISIVLGVVPWFDYVPGEDAWEVNEFFGELHPFDMLRAGHIHPDLRVGPAAA